MPRLTKRTERYANGTICASKDGHTFNASIYLAGGERRRARLKSRNAAKLWLDSQASEYRTLSQAEMLDASRAYAMLPEGTTLLECAKFYLESKVAAISIPVEDAIDRFISSRRTMLRDVSVKWYEKTLNRFLEEVRDLQTLEELDRARIERVLECRTPSMRNALIRVLSAFYTWAIKSGYAPSNPMKGIEKSRLNHPKRAVLTVEQARAVLVICEYIQPAVLPYLAVGLFAGIRPYEMRKLRSSDFQHGYIHLDADVAKTSSERTVPIRNNLAAWLSKYPPTEGTASVADITITRTLRKLFACVGVDDRKDILRHSYASFAYELTGDAARVAAELGHTDTSMLFRHYRGLVPPGSGERFFALSPESVAQTLPKTRT